MAIRRCSTCSLDFPTHAKFWRDAGNTTKYPCPSCDEPTDHITNEEVPSDWKDQVFHAIERRHDAEREGPSPEEIGAMEAREILAEHERAIAELERQTAA